MKFLISFSPIRMDFDLSVRKKGDVLSINEELFDFSVIPDGASLPATAITMANRNMFVGDISRRDDTINLCFLLPHGPDPAYNVAFPGSIEVEKDGVVEVPA